MDDTPPQITINEARKLLGANYSYLDDTQILSIISELTDIARSYIEVVGSKKT